MSGKCHVLLTNCNYSLYSLLNSALCHILNGKFWLVRNGLSHTRHQNCVGDEIRAQDQPLQTGTHPLFCVVTSIPIRAALPFVGDWLGGDDERTLILFLRTGGCNVGLNVLCSCYYVGCWRRGDTIHTIVETRFSIISSKIFLIDALVARGLIFGTCKTLELVSDGW